MKKNKISILLLMATVLLLIACSKDEAGQDVTVVTPPQSGQTLRLESVTRASTIDATMENIKVLMSDDEKGAFFYEGSFVKTDAGWDHMVSADSKKYHIYGLMSAGQHNAALSTLPGVTNSFKEGAVMTLTKLPAALSANLCVITSVKSTPPSDGDPFVPGNYAFDNTDSKSKVSLHLDHLYASLAFDVSIGSSRGYSDLRTIKLTALKIRSKKLQKATVTLRAGQPLTDADILYTFADQSEDCPFYDGGGVLATPSDIVKATCFFVPELYNDMELVAVYDVYDKKNHLVRSQSEAVNKLPLSALKRGQQFTFRLTVEPSYIYQLHDADLDNPTIKIE